MKRVKLNIEKRDISEYPTNKQKFSSVFKSLTVIAIASLSLVIVFTTYSIISNAVDKRHDKAVAEQASKVVNDELSRWKEAQIQCGIENSVTQTPIDGKSLIGLDIVIPFSSIRNWDTTNYKNQIDCFSREIYGLSLNRNFKFNEELTKLSNSIFLDEKFRKTDGSSKSSGLWAVIKSTSDEGVWSQYKNVVIVCFYWSQS